MTETNKKIIFGIIIAMLLATLGFFIYLIGKVEKNAKPKDNSLQEQEIQNEQLTKEAEIIKSLSAPANNSNTSQEIPADAEVIKALSAPREDEKATPLPPEQEVIDSLSAPAK